MPVGQAGLFDQDFRTARPPNPLFCHQEFLEKLQTYRNLPVGKRASLLMQRLAVDERRQHYKSTRGVNQGWRRSRLGGSQGSHFYAWWAPKTAAPLRGAEGFQQAPDGAIILRDIRHHDDHSQAQANTFHGHYLPVSVPEIRHEEYGPAPWTVPQARFATARQPVRILKGHPGSGKTTALLHAADECGAARLLYLTYSADLATLARAYFDRYCSGARRFHVLTYSAFLRQLLRTDVPVAQFGELRRRFRGDLVPFARSLWAWTDRTAALYDELHAHLAGSALPVAGGRFAACAKPRVADKDYQQRRLKYLGEGAVATALDLAGRLERSDGRPLADRYFPELALAWQAAASLAGKAPSHVPEELLEFDCIAVDECQDLTPLEAYVVVGLAEAVRYKRGGQAAVFLAGDEAQTVRPTDFEWGWLNDLLHHRLGTPAEFKLGSNLRSPKTIAQLVNRVWDLYEEVEKRDRPRGTGYAEVEDDSTDPLIYCTAAPGEELTALLQDLASREGLALVSLDDALPQSLPESVRSSVLTPSEVKGLDFHTICVLNAGQQLDKIFKWREEYRYVAADIESIRRRLAIDELRVALSRPAERLIWLDVNPSARTVRTTLEFLNRNHMRFELSPTTPAAVTTALAEEQLDLEERLQRCQADARQYLSVKPDIAWSRAQQAVALLGDPANPASVRDESARAAARLTLAEICFCLAARNVHLAPELGRPDLFAEAARAADGAGRLGLASLLADLGKAMRADASNRLVALGELAQTFARHSSQIEPWVMTEIAGKIPGWLDELEAALPVGDNPVTLSRILPPFYEALRLPDAEARRHRFQERAIRFLLKNKRHAQALEILQRLPERKSDLEAECLDSMGEYARAAELYRNLGKPKEALACYRSIPDFEAAAALIKDLSDHPATEAYDWLIRLKEVLAGRPANFSRVMTPAEKKILEQMLEQGLGVKRRQPAPRKTTAAKKAPVKRAAAKKNPEYS